jgi:tetraacyldisaccharide 4'-kinase
MLDAGKFREIVSGRRRGASATLARGALRVAEWPYTWAIRWRNRRYDRDATPSIRVGVPVVSVGNLTLGGTGKTPMVKWLAHWFAERGVPVVIVSRGYGAADGEKNDEALELEQALPEVPHVQNPDRVAGARAAIERHGAQLVVLDDGFQHRRLARDLDIVLLDATEPFGFEHVFPRGTLREPVDGLRRADVVCLSRADLLDTAGREAIRRRVAELAPGVAWCEAAHRPAELRSARGETQPVSALAGRRVAAFCGIGNPSAFRRTLAELGAEVVSWREYPDHHAYSANDRADLSAVVESSTVELVVTTHKDLVKLPQAMLGDRPLWALAIDLQVVSGEAALVAALERVAAASATL